jgi:hypothetical protein
VSVFEFVFEGESRGRARGSAPGESFDRWPRPARRVSIAQRRSRSLSTGSISSLGASSRTWTASRAAAASDASPRAHRNRATRSLPTRLEASAIPRYADRRARRSWSESVPPWQTFRDLLSQPQSVACHRERVQAMMIEARQARSSRRSRPVVASRHAFRTTTTPASLEHELEHGHGHGLDHEHDPTYLNTAAMRSISLLYSWGYLRFGS